MSKKFNVGDKVKVVIGNVAGGYDKNAVGVISKVSPAGYDYEVDFGKDTGFTHHGEGHSKNHYRFYYTTNLELVEAKIYTTKYKPGDEVTVLPNLNGLRPYHMADGKNEMLPTEQMLTKRGKKVKIKSVTKTGKYMIEGSIFPWVDEMFVDEAETKDEPKKLSWKIEITPDGEKTIAKYYEDGKMVKTVAVTRYHEDVYDPEAAAKFVTQKLFAKGRSIITVQFDRGSRKYNYLCKGLSIKCGDKVIVPVGEDNHHVAVTVVAIQPFVEDKLHIPISKMKYVDRVCTEEETKPRFKFKVGDKVRVRKDLTNKIYYMDDNPKRGCFALSSQVKMGGEVVTITECKSNNHFNYYFVEGSSLMWTDGMFEDEVVKYFNGKVVCVSKPSGCAYTVGKVYEFKDGRVVIDNGAILPIDKGITTLEEWNTDDNLYCKFIPFVE